jgi:deoxyribodipyrimidine photo-lyase
VSCAVVLFTRDLRVRDHSALAAAAREAERVVPLFVFDDVLLRGRCGSPNRVAFLLDCLRDLDGSLRERGARLVLRRGDPVAEAIRVAGEGGASSIHLSDDYSAYARRRRERLAGECERVGLRLCVHAGVTVAEPGEISPAGGDHYRVFTPYWRVWAEQPRRQPHPALRRLALPSGLGAGRIPALNRMVDGTPSPELREGGESAARRRLERWLRGGLAGYGECHDDLAAADSTSHLSADLHFGCLSPAAVLMRVVGRPGGEAFARQLCWRDFHHQVLAARPDLPSVDYRGRGDRWRRSARLADAWRRGLTGYPIVDAGMRQLRAEAWVHNRIRMIVASFLVKDLHLDWTLGAREFLHRLVDGDLASNNHGWQWVAGCGTDAAPFHRVFNPVTQGRKFDPSGDYVRQYVPELRAVDGPAVHEPWDRPEGLPDGYPERIVDHAAARQEALARYERVRG